MYSVNRDLILLFLREKPGIEGKEGEKIEKKMTMLSPACVDVVTGWSEKEATWKEWEETWKEWEATWKEWEETWKHGGNTAKGNA